MSGQIRIANADIANGGLLVVFVDGTCAIFNADFLYEHRETDGNYTVIEDPKAADKPLGSS